MNRDDIIRMAQEAGPLISTPFDVWGERFAALVAAAVKPETAIAEAYRCGYEAGAIAARDACIALCTEHWQCGGTAIECADAIRARGDE